MECWCNVHRRVASSQPAHGAADIAGSGSGAVGEAWSQFSYIQPHQHSFPFHGYITLNAEPSNTTFRSPFTKKLFSLQGQNGRLAIFPGGVRHTTHPWSGSDPRVTIAFNIDLAPPGTRVYCQIPLVLEYCQRQQAGRVNWIRLLGEERVAELEMQQKMALDVGHAEVTRLYGGTEQCRPAEEEGGSRQCPL